MDYLVTVYDDAVIHQCHCWLWWWLLQLLRPGRIKQTDMDAAGLCIFCVFHPDFVH